MSDIVERLRLPFCKDGELVADEAVHDMREAADEIERLRVIAARRKNKKDIAHAARNDHARGLDYWRERALAAETALAAGEQSTAKREVL